MPIEINNKKVYIQKEYRGFKYEKITHTQITSLLKVLAFAYLGFKVENLDAIMEQVNGSLFFPTERTKVDAPGRFILIKDNKLVSNKRLDYYSESQIIPATNLRDRHMWPCIRPIIIKEEDKAHTFKYTEYMKLEHFVAYVNNVFNSKISTIIQNPLILVYNDINIKYTIYKTTNNLNVFSKIVMPSIFDFVSANNLVEYINKLK